MSPGLKILWYTMLIPHTLFFVCIGFKGFHSGMFCVISDLIYVPLLAANIFMSTIFSLDSAMSLGLPCSILDCIKSPN